MYVNIKLKGIDKALKKFGPQIVRRASVMAVNDIAKQGTAAAKRQIAMEYNIKPSRIARFLKVTARASGSKTWAVITGIGKGLALSYFGAKQEGVFTSKKSFRYTRRAQRQGNLRRGGEVTVQVKKAGGRKVVTTEPKPFIVRLKSGHMAVMQRQGEKKLPVKELFGPGVGLLFGSKRIMGNVTKLINEKFGPRFTYWLNRYRGERS